MPQLSPSPGFPTFERIVSFHPWGKTWKTSNNGKRSPWIERAYLDGITLRVSLDPQGRPFMVDVMNNCGCNHSLEAPVYLYHRSEIYS